MVQIRFLYIVSSILACLQNCSVPRIKGFSKLGWALPIYIYDGIVPVTEFYSEVDHTSVLYIRLIILLLTDTSLIASSQRSYDNMIFARGASQSKIEHPYFNLIVSASSSWEPSPIIVLFS